MLYPYPLKDTKKGTKDIVNKDIILILLEKNHILWFLKPLKLAILFQFSTQSPKVRKPLKLFRHLSPRISFYFPSKSP